MCPDRVRWALYTFPTRCSRAQATARLGALQLPEKPRDYQTGERPSMWFPATEVWEIRGADLTISPVHKVHHCSPPHARLAGAMTTCVSMRGLDSVSAGSVAFFKMEHIVCGN